MGLNVHKTLGELDKKSSVSSAAVLEDIYFAHREQRDLILNEMKRWREMLNVRMNK
jgi:hypothetical protein